MSDIEYSVIKSDVIKSFDCIIINTNFQTKKRGKKLTCAVEIMEINNKFCDFRS